MNKNKEGIPLINFNEGIDSSFEEELVSDELYAKILDSVVVTVVDILCFDSEGRILLGKRTRDPVPDWWIIGGRMMRGESFHATAVRKIKEEIGIHIEEDRLTGFLAGSYVWERRAQEPQNNGCHTAGIVMTVTLDDEEILSIKPNDEYSELKWIFPKDIISESSEKYHQVIMQIARFITASRN